LIGNGDWTLIGFLLYGEFFLEPVENFQANGFQPGQSGLFGGEEVFHPYRLGLHSSHVKL